MNAFYIHTKRYVLKHKKPILVSTGFFFFLQLLSGLPYFNILLTPVLICLLTVGAAVILINVSAKYIALFAVLLFIYAFILLMFGREQDAQQIGDGTYLLLWLSVIQLWRKL